MSNVVGFEFAEGDVQVQDGQVQALLVAVETKKTAYRAQFVGVDQGLALVERWADAAETCIKLAYDIARQKAKMGTCDNSERGQALKTQLEITISEQHDRLKELEPEIGPLESRISAAIEKRAEAEAAIDAEQRDEKQKRLASIFE